MNIVVTGATGLIGSRLTAALRNNHEVWAVARQAAAAQVDGHVRWVSGDLTSQSLPEGLPTTADVVVHLAQSEHYRQFPDRALDVFEVNVASTARLLDWSLRAGVRQFILASSGAVGAMSNGKLTYYIASKQSAELLTEAYAEYFDVLALRFFFVYGRGQKRSMLVPRLIDTIRSDREVTIVGRDGPRLNPIHVDDAVRALLSAIDRRSSGRIDIAGREVLTVRQMSETIARCLGRGPRFKHDLAARADDLVGDVALMNRLLVAPQYSFAEGIADVIASANEETH
jgi:UDP-glucose 4-epimerase